MALPRIDDETKQEMEELSTAEYGVNTFSCSMSGNMTMEDPDLIEIFDTASKLGSIVAVNAENDVVVREGERKMLAAGIMGPEGFAMAHPEEAEVTSFP